MKHLSLLVAGLAVAGALLAIAYGPAPKPPAVQVTSQGPTVERLARLMHLVTTRVYIADVLTAEGEGYRGAWLIKGDALIGVNLRQVQITEKDFQTRRATICLPPPEVLQSRVDHERTRTWEVRKTTWVLWGGDPDSLRDTVMRQGQRLVAAAARLGREPGPGPHGRRGHPAGLLRGGRLAGADRLAGRCRTAVAGHPVDVGDGAFTFTARSSATDSLAARGCSSPAPPHDTAGYDRQGVASAGLRRGPSAAFFSIPVLGETLLMSHTVTIETVVRDAAAVRAACRRLSLAEPVQGTHRLYSGEATGLAVQLPAWQHPVVAELASGQLKFDNFNGRWGEQKHLDRFLQAYAVEKARLEARKKGCVCTEQTLADGSIKLTIQVAEGTA